MHRIQLFAPRFAVAAALCSASLLIPGTSGVAGSGAAPASIDKNQAMHVAKHIDLVSKEAQFAAAFPGVRIDSWQGATTVYGRAFAQGNSPKATAESFRINQVPMLLEGSGVQAEELKPYADFLAHTNTNTIGLMYNQETGQYKFTAIYYTQERSGLEVFGTRMTLLTRNEKNNPLVLADFHVRDMGAFQITDAEKASAKPAASLAAVNAVLGRGATIFKGPRLMVWAGLEEQKVTPTLAYELSGEGGNFLQGTLKARRFVTDAATGAILYQEDLIHDVDVAGNVAGLGTAGIGADTCGGGVASMPIPYARMTAGATTVFTDVNGNYVMPNAGAVPVSITASLTGQYFDLKTCSGTSVPSPQGAPCPTASTLTQSVTPPGPGNFLFNSPDAVLKRAEVNTYVHANKVRDVVVTHHPTFPTISTELNFKTNVNINNSCNAYYSSAQQSINFYIAGGTCTNTSNSTVVHHEYGHRIVNAAGSGQGAYGEGFGDCMAVIVTDQSCLGKGFSSGSSSPPCSPAPADCAGCLRTAANTAQYQAAGCSSCGSAIHSCGMLISGCVWSTRNYLQATHPGTYLDILRDLVVNSVLLHTPSSNTSITPAITVHFLTLDDDDADINNGTPHYNQINAGFTDHNMAGPPLQVGLNVTPSGANSGLVSAGPAGGPFSPPNKVYTVQNVGSSAINYQVTANQPWLSLTNASGTLAGNATVLVTVSFNAAANSLPNGAYSAVVSFTNTTNGQGSTTRDVSLEVGRVLAHFFDMNTNPGWTMDAGWLFGVPCGCGAAGALDPAAGFTGTNVFGYAAGSYPNNLTPERYLRTTALNCANLTGTQLKFRRWLGVEHSQWDHARIHVSTNGTTWTEIWRNAVGTANTINEQAWSYQSYDISAVADGQATVYVRWQMGTTDTSVVYQGWNIDDVEIWGFLPTCPTDCTGDGVTNVNDLLLVINSWGPCAAPCPADVTPAGGDGQVNVNDLLAVINGWGACP